MNRNAHFIDSLRISRLQAEHPEFFKTPVGGRRPDLGDLENAQIVKQPKPVIVKQVKRKPIKPGTIIN